MGIERGLTAATVHILATGCAVSSMRTGIDRWRTTCGELGSHQFVAPLCHWSEGPMYISTEEL